VSGNLQRAGETIGLLRGFAEERRARALEVVEECDRELAQYEQIERVLSGAELKPSEGASAGSSHLPERPSQPPSSRRSGGHPAREAALARQETVLETMRRLGRLVSRGDLLDHTQLTTSEVYGALRGLQQRGEITKHGDGRNTVYGLNVDIVSDDPIEPRKFPPPPSKPSRGSQEIKVDSGTPDGRVLEYCQLNPNSSGPAISLALGIGLNELRPIFGSLMREGLLRTAHKHGETVYKAVVL